MILDQRQEPVERSERSGIHHLMMAEDADGLVAVRNDQFGQSLDGRPLVEWAATVSARWRPDAC